LLSVPVIFAPEIRRALERIGRAGTLHLAFNKTANPDDFEQTMHTITTAAARLSARQHGALIILQRLDNLDEYIRSGVRMNAEVTPELLLQIFYPNTPLHDGAAILSGPKVVAAACVLPLSASGILNRSPERQMGLRHRAALGISEVSDAIAVVISEETGAISIAHAGRMIRRIDAERLENILIAFFRPAANEHLPHWLRRFLPSNSPSKDE
jgi:diadenylate cyclase